MLRAVGGVSQGKKQRGAFFESQGLGAGGGLHSRMGQGGAQTWLGIVRLEIVPQGFALLAEGELEEIDEAVFDISVAIESEFFLPRSDGEPQSSGMHFGRRSKC